MHGNVWLAIQRFFKKKKALCFVWKCSHSTIVDILCDWLTLESFVDLDTANCNKKERDMMMKLVVAYATRFKESFWHPLTMTSMTYQYIMWLDARRISVPSSIHILRSVMYDYSYSTEIAASLSNKWSKITSLKFNSVMDQATVLKSILQKCTNLEEISLIEIGECGSVIVSLAAHCRKLKKVSIMNSYDLSDAPLNDLCRRCSQLKHLQIICYRYVVSHTLSKIIALHCKKLVSLKLPETMDKRGIHILIFHAVSKSLHQFTIVGMTDVNILNYMACRGSLINDLVLLPNCFRFERSSLYTRLLSDCQSLMSLSLTLGKENKLLVDGICSLKHLKSLKCDNGLPPYNAISNPLTAGELLRLFTSLKHLEVLFLADAFPDADSERLLTLGTCATLHSLSIVNEHNLTNNVLLAVLLSLPLLTSLCIESSPLITDELFELIKQSFSSIKLCNCSGISDATLVSLATNCLDLTLLDVSNSNRITDRGVAAISLQCKKLQNLNLFRCFNITQQTLRHLTQHNRRYLVDLVICIRRPVDEKVLWNFVLNCRRMRHLRCYLDISRIHDVDDIQISYSMATKCNLIVSVINIDSI